jgi:hypothetical protein
MRFREFKRVFVRFRIHIRISIAYFLSVFIVTSPFKRCYNPFDYDEKMTILWLAIQIKENEQ